MAHWRHRGTPARNDGRPVAESGMAQKRMRRREASRWNLLGWEAVWNLLGILWMLIEPMWSCGWNIGCKVLMRQADIEAAVSSVLA